jgi:formylmethanofuran dehydrogenase subunit C
MSALRLSLRDAPPARVDCSPLLPSTLGGKSAKEIGAQMLATGLGPTRLDALFKVAGTAGDTLVFEGATSRLDGIGTALNGGTIEVDGDAGDLLGRNMASGTIRVSGRVGYFAASGMTGGEIRIKGDAGDFLAAALPGEHRGLKGGLVLVEGNAGDRAGDRMRRGTLLIGGNTGRLTASRMVAGTLAVAGTVGPGAATAMRRGTLLLPTLPAGLPATFNDCGAYPLSFLTLLARAWRGLPAPFGDLPAQGLVVRRLMGDLANDGRGEVLVMQ